MSKKPRRPPHLIPERDADVKRPPDAPNLPRRSIITEQDEMEQIEELAQAIWEVVLRQSNRRRIEAFHDGDREALSRHDPYFDPWHKVTDVIRERYRWHARRVFEWGANPEKPLVEQVAEAIYESSPWCRPYKRDGLIPGVGIVPWKYLGEHRMGRDIKRACEVKARRAITAVHLAGMLKEAPDA